MADTARDGPKLDLPKILIESFGSQTRQASSGCFCPIELLICPRNGGRNSGVL
jgi:hypothetical protein